MKTEHAIDEDAPAWVNYEGEWRAATVAFYLPAAVNLCCVMIGVLGSRFVGLEDLRPRNPELNGKDKPKS